MNTKAVVVSTTPAPYREVVYQLAAERLDGDFHVIYPSTIEPNRKWDVQEGDYPKSFLKSSFITFRGRYIHVNLSVWGELNRLDPGVVITVGFNPTHLLAFLWCMVYRRKHVPFIDGFLVSEQDLSPIHFRVRKIVYRFSKACIGPSRHSLDMYRHYGLPDNALFQSHLCADNDRYAAFLGAEKKYDIVFSGQIIPRKMPGFFVEVARLLNARRPGLKALILGDGPDRESMLEKMRATGVDFTFAGFCKQADLPARYASGRVFLFPSLQEPWGVVANEACAVGVPVITTPNVGAAGDLVLHGFNGFVLEPDPLVWTEHVLRLLENRPLWEEMSRNALAKVKEYNYSAAAQGIVNAVRFCRQHGSSRK